jgi:TATA-binding protein-associated factor Taf7
LIAGYQDKDGNDASDDEDGEEEEDEDEEEEEEDGVKHVQNGVLSSANDNEGGMIYICLRSFFSHSVLPVLSSNF